MSNNKNNYYEKENKFNRLYKCKTLGYRTYNKA